MSILDIVWMVAKILIVFVVLLMAMAYLTLVERRFVAWFQWRLGPNRVGPWGLIQPIADGVKLLLKQELIPANADKFVYLLAPVISLVAAFAIISVVPITEKFYIADVNVALLLVLALSSLGTYGIILAGWSSGSKYPFIGALRSCAQMIAGAWLRRHWGHSAGGNALVAGDRARAGAAVVFHPANTWFRGLPCCRSGRNKSSAV